MRRFRDWLNEVRRRLAEGRCGPVSAAALEVDYGF